MRGQTPKEYNLELHNQRGDPRRVQSCTIRGETPKEYNLELEIHSKRGDPKEWCPEIHSKSGDPKEWCPEIHSKRGDPKTFTSTLSRHGTRLWAVKDSEADKWKVPILEMRELNRDL